MFAAGEARAGDDQCQRQPQTGDYRGSAPRVLHRETEAREDEPADGGARDCRFLDGEVLVEGSHVRYYRQQSVKTW